MIYKMSWIGEVGFGIVTEGGREIGFSLADGQRVPDEFREGDEVKLHNHPDHPALLAVGVENHGYYEITHVATGKKFEVLHRNDMWRLDE
jgi:hypothetical protein